MAPPTTSTASPPELPRKPLTVKNLRLHTQQTSPEKLHAMAGDSTTERTKGSRTIRKEEIQLENFGVHINVADPVPEDLQRFLNNVINAPRASTSPTAKKIQQKSLVAAAWNEGTAVRILANDLLFASGCVPGLEGEKYIVHGHYLPFSAGYFTNGSTKIPFAIPDSVLGYVQWETAQLGGTMGPFDEAEEAVIQDDAIAEDVLFPFLTAEYKSTGNCRREAMILCARAGIGMNNYLYKFFLGAGDQTPTAVDTCHFSIACNFQMTELYMHWRALQNGKVIYCMKRIGSSLLIDDDDPDNPALQRFRKKLRNLLEYAQGTRLERIKEAIGKIQKLDSSKTKRSGSTLTSQDVDQDDD